MTSPYLNRPVRSLNDALRARGLSPTDVGLESGADGVPAPAEVAPRKPLPRWRTIAVAAIFLVALAGLAIFVGGINVDGKQPGAKGAPDSLEAQAERLNDSVVPAAGSDGQGRR